MSFFSFVSEHGTFETTHDPYLDELKRIHGGNYSLKDVVKSHYDFYKKNIQKAKYLDDLTYDLLLKFIKEIGWNDAKPGQLIILIEKYIEDFNQNPLKTIERALENEATYFDVTNASLLIHNIIKTNNTIEPKTLDKIHDFIQKYNKNEFNINEESVFSKKAKKLIDELMKVKEVRGSKFFEIYDTQFVLNTII